jgi:hypothetical protein
MRVLKTAGISALITGLAFSNSAIAQSFTEGTNVLGVGLGIGGNYNVGFAGSGVSQSPAIAFHFDHGMGDLGPGVWGLGGFLGYKRIGNEYTIAGNNFIEDYSYTYLVFGARGSWHYNAWHGNDKVDTYGGIMLAYRSLSFSNNTAYPSNYNGLRYSYSGGGIDFTGFLGARYFFTDKIGAYAEVGYGVSVLQLGLAVKL